MSNGKCLPETVHVSNPMDIDVVSCKSEINASELHHITSL